MDNKIVKITENGVQIELGARDMVMHVLTQIGCQYTIDKDDDICFSYQGERFCINADNEHAFITIWDFWWRRCELDDEEFLSRLKYVINDSNWATNTTTFYAIDENEGAMAVHSKKTVLFVPQIPNIEDYFRAMLDEIFEAHRFILLGLEKNV